MNQQRPRLNNQIKASQVEVIGFSGEKLGTMPLYEALRLAQEQNLDVVEVNPTAQPPLVKIIDYGKYTYQKERSGKGGSQKHAGQEVKTVQIGFRTESHDLGIRASQIEKFLLKGYRVKVEMKLRGREKGMVQLGREKFEQFMQLISEEFVVDAPIKAVSGVISIMVRKK